MSYLIFVQEFLSLGKYWEVSHFCYFMSYSFIVFPIWFATCIIRWCWHHEVFLTIFGAFLLINSWSSCHRWRSILKFSRLPCLSLFNVDTRTCRETSTTSSCYLTATIIRRHGWGVLVLKSYEDIKLFLFFCFHFNPYILLIDGG